MKIKRQTKIGACFAWKWVFKRLLFFFGPKSGF